MIDRIKLAEAMDWIPYPMGADPNDPATSWESADNKFHANFNPFTDANDDYAVLEWMRSPLMYGKGFVYTKIFKFLGSEYQIGDYARACLRILDE